jgi:hypothetical protein
MTKKMITETIESLEVDSILFGNYESCSIDEMRDNVSDIIEHLKELSDGYENVTIRKEHFGYDGAFNVKVTGDRLETDAEYSNRLAAEQKKADRKARAAAAKKPTQDEAAAIIEAMFSSDEEMMAVLNRLAVR